MDEKANRTAIGVTGLALLVGFFLPWIDFGFGPGVSGFTVVKNVSSTSLFHLMMLMVPLGGLAMAGCALLGSKHTRLVSAVVGLSLVGYGVVKTVHAFFATTGLGLWVVIAGSCAALLLPFLVRKSRF